MTRTPLIISAVALATLAACDTSSDNAAAVNAAEANAAAAAPVVLPPAITASPTFRCRDNSLVYVDFFDGTFVNFRTERGTPPVVLRAEAPGEPFVAEGYRLTGTPQQIELTQPDVPQQSCRA